MMKYLLALLIMVSSPAWAEWAKVAEGVEGTELFVNYSTIRIEGSKRKVWQLTNFSIPKTALGREVLSLRARVEFDCKQEQQRLLSVSIFSQYFAGGEVIKTENDGTNWQDIPPDAVGWKILQSVCKAPAR
jgi:hypothetical protein